MKIKNIIITLTTLSALLFTACGGDDDENTDIIYTDIVTVESIDPSATTFTLRQDDDSPLVTLIYQGDINKGLPDNTFVEDTRIAISYIPKADKHYVNSTIELLSATNIYGGGAEVPVVSRTGMSDFDSNDISLNSLWRTGEYINAIFIATSGPNPKQCRMVVDAETLDDKFPCVYLVFKPEQNLNMTQYGFYMSYSLKDIFSRPSCGGVKVFFNDPNQAQKSVIFTKTSGSFTPSTPIL